jgi:hypothetical protein
MCQVLEISRSGITTGTVRKERGRSQRDRILPTEIRKIHQDIKEAYGAIKTWRALKEAGIGCGKPPRGTTETAGRYRSSAQMKISRGVSGAS